MSYTRVAIALHWLIAILLVMVFVLGLLMTSESVASIDKFRLFRLHKSIGLTILLLSFLRLVWRALHKPPPMPEAMKSHEKLAANFVHIAFYAFMIGLPVLGWVIVSASSLGIPTMVYGVLLWPHIPMPFDENIRKTIGGFASELHEIGAYLMFALLLLHIGAALKHHFYDRDDVLTRMIPILKQRK